MNDKMNRRSALLTLGRLGAGAAAIAAVPSVAVAQSARPNVDGDVLNFALNLEYLEAAFYAAAVGRLDEVRELGGGAEIRLPAGFTGRSAMRFSSNATRQYAEEIAEDEISHVRFLRSALGASAVARPVLDLGPAFDAAGQAASGGAIRGFNPFANDLFFLHGAYIFEDVGVTAYRGAAPLLTDPTVLGAAAGILAVEAYHAGEIRTLLFERRAMPAAAGLNVGQVTQAISDLRAKVGGGKDQGLTRGGMANIVVADSNSVAFGRTTREVLNIVYLAPGASRGGFFPNGLNGAIR
ncbi:ferritin-like domain-containing protein [Deinococcus pimensis]|uniref:ferritin-like domain-containing protein n=1 Tax=Deinococcus pimensis TaxID=309888 RepID=UPI0004AF3784|nr:ferritin-like domain-containing protein [Deinococcus pimensis]